MTERLAEETNKRIDNLAFTTAPGNIATEMRKSIQAHIEDSCNCIERSDGHVIGVVNGAARTSASPAASIANCVVHIPYGRLNS